LEFPDFWYQKTSVLSYGVVCVILGLAIFVELRLATDTRCSIYRGSMASRGKKNELVGLRKVYC